MARYVFTSESVTEGHPDKICDQVSDAVLDALLEQDPASRVACETVVNTGLCLITGEVTTTARVDFNTLVRGVIERIGYNGARAGGFDAHSCAVLVALDQQSPDIAQGVNEADDHDGDPLDRIGAGLLNLAGEPHPVAGPDPVEAGDHGHGQPGPGSADLLQDDPVAAMAQTGLRQIAEGLAITVGPLQRQPVQGQLVPLDLLLEQGVEHHRGGTGVLEGDQLLQVVAEGRRSPHHQGSAQLQPQVTDRQVGVAHRSSGVGATAGASAGAAGPSPGMAARAR